MSTVCDYDSGSLVEECPSGKSFILAITKYISIKVNATILHVVAKFLMTFLFS